MGPEVFATTRVSRRDAIARSIRPRSEGANSFASRRLSSGGLPKLEPPQQTSPQHDTADAAKAAHQGRPQARTATRHEELGNLEPRGEDKKSQDDGHDLNRRAPSDRQCRGRQAIGEKMLQITRRAGVGTVSPRNKRQHDEEADPHNPSRMYQPQYRQE